MVFISFLAARDSININKEQYRSDSNRESRDMLALETIIEIKRWNCCTTVTELEQMKYLQNQYRRKALCSLSHTSPCFFSLDA